MIIARLIRGNNRLSGIEQKKRYHLEAKTATKQNVGHRANSGIKELNV